MGTKKLTLPTGETVDIDAVDELIQIWERASKVRDKCDQTRLLIAKLLADKTPDTDVRTRRCEGGQFRAIIQMPDEGYDNQRLIKLWNTYEPAIRDRVLKLEKIGIRKRELKKLRNSKLPPTLDLLVKQIDMAATGPAGNPRIEKVEKVNEQAASKDISHRQTRPGGAAAG